MRNTWESPLSCTEKCKPDPTPDRLSQGWLCVHGVHTQRVREDCGGETSCRLRVLYSKVTHPVFLINYFLFRFDWRNTIHTISLSHLSDLQKVVFWRLCPIQQSLIQHLHHCWNQLRLLLLREEFLLISVGAWAGKEYRMPSITKRQAKNGRKMFYRSLWFWHHPNSINRQTTLSYMIPPNTAHNIK